MTVTKAIYTYQTEFFNRNGFNRIVHDEIGKEVNSEIIHSILLIPKNDYDRKLNESFKYLEVSLRVFIKTFSSLYTKTTEKRFFEIDDYINYPIINCKLTDLATNSNLFEYKHKNIYNHFSLVYKNKEDYCELSTKLVSVIDKYGLDFLNQFKSFENIREVIDKNYESEYVGNSSSDNRLLAVIMFSIIFQDPEIDRKVHAIKSHLKAIGDLAALDQIDNILKNKSDLLI